MTEEPTLKQFNFLKGKNKWVEGMTKQQAHDAIALIIPPVIAPKVPNGQVESAGAETVNMTATASSEEKPKTNGFKLTDGNIRIGALTCGLTATDINNPDFWDLVKEFEEYIRNGK